MGCIEEWKGLGVRRDYAMGGTSSKLEKSLGGQLPDGENYYGLENFGNTCYCNSVLQALYFCQPFREKILERAQSIGSNDGDNLLDCLSNLFLQIHTQKKKTGVIAPKRFVQRLKKDNELFRSYMHQVREEPGGKGAWKCAHLSSLEGCALFRLRRSAN